MGLSEYLEKEETGLIRAEEGQLIIAKQIQEQFIQFENQKKLLEKKEKELNAKIEEVMRTSGITRYESNDKRIKITLGKDSTSYDIDKNYLYEKYPDIYRECNIKETSRKGSLRITIREAKE